MKYIMQFGIIIAVSFVGEIIRFFIRLPIPAGIYGLLIMLVALKTRVIKIDAIREASDFLVEIMPVMFIPAAVGLLESYSSFSGILLPSAFMLVITTAMTIAATGFVTQAVIKTRKQG